MMLSKKRMLLFNKRIMLLFNKKLKVAKEEKKEFNQRIKQIKKIKN